jgi:hypothetical protein
MTTIESFDYEKDAYIQKVFKTTLQYGKLIDKVEDLKSGDSCSYGAIKSNFMT